MLEVTPVSTDFEDMIRINSQRLADLKKTTAEIEQELSNALVSLERQAARPGYQAAMAGQDVRTCDCAPGTCYCDAQTARYEAMSGPWDPPPGRRPTEAGPWAPRPGQWDPEPGAGAGAPDPWDPPTARYAAVTGAYQGGGDLGDQPAADAGSPSFGPAGYPYEGADFTDPVPSSEERTAALLSHGRPSAYRRRLSRRTKIATATAAMAAFIAIVVVLASGGGASWPASVARVQSQISRACGNPDVMSEPGQVNFACAKATRQILWVFSLITSGNNPNYADARTGRLGLEPISPTQGGQLAASLNLHHPYNPTNPIDSLQVAARAINDIIAGATLTGANGSPVVQAGLESDSGNCVRYTGSPSVISRQGFPNLCANPVTNPAGQSALVADIYRKWVVGAPAQSARSAAVLFQNATNPGDPGVQAILKHLPNSALSP
jgi:hypothetical protein